MGMDFFELLQQTGKNTISPELYSESRTGKEPPSVTSDASMVGCHCLPGGLRTLWRTISGLCGTTVFYIPSYHYFAQKDAYMIDQHDAQAARCPMLGHEVPFSYCRQPGEEVPCRKIFDCWWEKLDIRTFIAENYSEEVQLSLSQPAKPKMLTLLEIIEQARKNTSTSP